MIQKEAVLFSEDNFFLISIFTNIIGMIRKYSSKID